jgi:hypothetical protein
MSKILLIQLIQPWFYSVFDIPTLKIGMTFQQTRLTLAFEGYKTKTKKFNNENVVQVSLLIFSIDTTETHSNTSDATLFRFATRIQIRNS